VLDIIKNRRKFSFQFGELDVLEERKRYRIKESRQFLIGGKGLTLALGIYRKSSKSYKLKIVHVLPGVPSEIDRMPSNWVISRTGEGCTIEWPEETFSKSSIKLFEISKYDTLGNYELNIYIDHELSTNIFFTVGA